MKQKLSLLKEQHIKVLDRFAESLAIDFYNGDAITSKIIQAIVDFYDSASIEKSLNNENFSSTYHSPVTADFEFILARLFYHIGIIYNLGWKIDLRSQIQKSAPDIRISKDNKTLWVLELKASMSFARSFISPIFYLESKEKFTKGTKIWSPDEFNKKMLQNIEKYLEVFSIPKENFFFIVPSLASVHFRRKGKGLTLTDYQTHFSNVSGFLPGNLLVLNEKLNQNLAEPKETKEVLHPTNHLENMIYTLLSS